MKAGWRPGNRVRLLENGEDFFPRVFEAINRAEREVYLETFILFEDKVGMELHKVLCDAARRGVRVDVTADAYGSPDLSSEFISKFSCAGVHFHLFDPAPKVFGLRTNLFRRMHRKLVVVDRKIGFVGGINFSADHLGDFGPQAKQDYAVELEGPIVDDLYDFAEQVLQPVRPTRRWLRRMFPAPRPAYARAGTAQALFVTRDNDTHRTDIERQYRLAIRSAKHEVVIANAYFFPRYRLLRELRNAARRGVKVRIIVQGEPDLPIVPIAARALYHYLVPAGVRIYEYCERPLHGKVALVDDEWATVGSSNLDPLSLGLNLEANVVIRDRAFNHALRERLDGLMQNHCKLITPAKMPKRTWWQALQNAFALHFLRSYPKWLSWLPAHRPRLHRLSPDGHGHG